MSISFYIRKYLRKTYSAGQHAVLLEMHTKAITHKQKCWYLDQQYDMCVIASMQQSNKQEYWSIETEIELQHNSLFSSTNEGKTEFTVVTDCVPEWNYFWMNQLNHYWCNVVTCKKSPSAVWP